jgi:type IV pilus assembly protein PilN
MRFTINLATRTYLDHRLINRVIVASILLLTALSAWKVVSFCWNLGELERLKGDIASLEGRLAGHQAGVSEKEYNRQLSTIRFFNGVIEQKTNNWLTLLEQLENATPEGIALVSLAPDMKTGTIKVEGLARNFDHIRSYLDHLEDSKTFSNILLLSHGDIAVGDKKSRGVKFVISCRLVNQ